MSTAEREIDILETIHRSAEPVRQRNISRAIGLSLGMTNAILKRLAKKGWLSIRKINTRNIQYVVSPKGVEQIAGRSYRYLRRTIGNIVRYKEAIEKIVREARERGCTKVVLIGESDLVFLVQHACATHGVALRTTRRQADQGRPPSPGSDTLVLLSETVKPGRSLGRTAGGGPSAACGEGAELSGAQPGVFHEQTYLRDILIADAR